MRGATAWWGDVYDIPRRYDPGARRAPDWQLTVIVRAFERAAQARVGDGDLSEQLQRALNSRVVIEQAKGAVAERAAVDMAFAWLRGYARANNRRLGDVATAVVDRTLAVDALRTSSTGSHELR
jgi:hypothetical protein